MKTENLMITISRLSTAIEYITWAVTEDDDKSRLEWLHESDKMIENAKKWLNKEIPF